MAKKPGKPFSKGQSGNPGGRPKQSEADKVLTKLTREQFSDIAEMIVLGQWDAIEQIVKNETETVLRKLIAQCLIKAGSRGDWYVVDKLLDRLIGKPKENVEVTHFRRVVRKLDGTAIEYTTEEDKEK